jgi:hypothetical protein
MGKRSRSRNTQKRIDRRNMHKRIRQAARRVLGGRRSGDPHVSGAWRAGKYKREVPDNEAGEQ